MAPEISTKTAQTVADLVRSLGKQQMLPPTEAQAAASILLAAAKPQKDDPRPPGSRRPMLMTTGEAAKCLACSRKTVLRMADDGLLTRRFLRVGNPKSLRFAESEVSAICGVAQDDR